MRGYKKGSDSLPAALAQLIGDFLVLPGKCLLPQLGIGFGEVFVYAGMDGLQAGGSHKIAGGFFEVL